MTGLVTARPPRTPTTDGSCPLLPIICPPPPPPPPPPTSRRPRRPSPPCGCTVAHPITTWQIWNEQNSPKYFAPKAAPTQLREAPPRHGRGDPRRRPERRGRPRRDVGTELGAAGRDAGHQYLKRFYAVKGIEQSFDSIAIHPYSTGAEDSVDAARVGARVPSRRPTIPSVGHVGERDRLGRRRAEEATRTSRARQGPGEVLTRALTAYQHKQRSLHLRGVFWYSWRDKKGGNAICEWCGHAGLRKKNGVGEAGLEGVRPHRPRVTSGRPPAAVGSGRLAVALALLRAESGAGGAEDASSASSRRRRSRPTTITRMGPRTSDAALRGSDWATDRSRARRPATRTGRRPTRSSAARAREGIRTLPFVFDTPTLGARARRSRVRHERCPPYAPTGRASARRRGAAFSPPRVDRYGPEGSFWASTPSSPRSRSAPGRSGTSRTRPRSSPRSRACAATRDC